MPRIARIFADFRIAKSNSRTTPTRRLFRLPSGLPAFFPCRVPPHKCRGYLKRPAATFGLSKQHRSTTPRVQAEQIEDKLSNSRRADFSQPIQFQTVTFFSWVPPMWGRIIVLPGACGARFCAGSIGSVGGISSIGGRRFADLAAAGGPPRTLGYGGSSRSAVCSARQSGGPRRWPISPPPMAAAGCTASRQHALPSAEFGILRRTLAPPSGLNRQPGIPPGAFRPHPPHQARATSPKPSRSSYRTAGLRAGEALAKLTCSSGHDPVQ